VGEGEGDGREGEEGRKVETPPSSIPAYAPVVLSIPCILYTYLSKIISAIFLWLAT